MEQNNLSDKSEIEKLITVKKSRYEAALAGDTNAIISYLKDVAGWRA